MYKQKVNKLGLRKFHLRKVTIKDGVCLLAKEQTLMG